MAIKEKRRWAENVLKFTGYKVDRQGFGTIAYEPRYINEGLNYLKQSGEIAAFAALPQVLKRGEIIERHDNHKGRNFGTVTIAAPVMINGVRGNMAAVVQMTGENHYHTHRILMPDGSTFEFRQKNSTDSKPAGATPNTDAHATPMDSVHNSSIRSLAANSQEKSSDPDIRYSLREEFSGEIDSWAEDGMPEGVRFTLGSTGPVLQGLGAIESDIYMEGNKIQKILQDHPEMTLAEIKKVPQILEDPALILKSEGRGKSGANSRLVCFGLTKAQNGQPVMTVMDLRPRENGFVVDDMQKVNSAYTKKNPMAFIQKSDVVYADKKRAIPLLRTTGLTISSQQLLRNGYIGSISYKGSSVNIEGVPFSSVVKTAENTGNDRHALRDVAMSDRDVLRRAADLALNDRKMNFTQADRERLKIFKKRLDILDEKQTQRQGYLQAKRDILSNSARLF